MSGPMMTMSAQVPMNRQPRGVAHSRPLPASNARAYTPRRRNALIPLPLLPPPPPHAIIKSVTVVHPVNGNHNGNTGNNRGRRRSSASKGNNNVQDTTGAQAANVPFPKASSPTSPTSPHPLTVRNRGGPRRRSAGFFNGPPLAGRPAPQVPRQSSANTTFVVTVRIPPPPKYIPPPQPAAQVRKPIITSGIKPVPSYRRPYQDPVSPPPKPAFNRPRVSSAFATHPAITAESLNDDHMVIDQPIQTVAEAPAPPFGTQLHPRSVPRPRSKLNVPGAKGKPASLVIRRCAVLNASGPEKGRRIWCLGVRLAQEIWEAEECLKAQELVENDHEMEDAEITSAIMVTTTMTETWSDIVPVEQL